MTKNLGLVVNPNEPARSNNCVLGPGPDPDLNVVETTITCGL